MQLPRSVSATEQIYLPPRHHSNPSVAYRSPIEVPPATIKAGWNAYFVTSFESYNCPAPWSLLDSDAVKNASPHYCTQVLAPLIDNSALSTLTNTIGPWKQNYNGIFSAHLLPQPDGVPAFFAITHGENKGENPPYAGPGTGFFTNTFLPYMINTVTPTVACLEDNGCYFATVNLAQKPFTANTNWAQMPFEESGPITWPAAGYIGGQTINNGITSTVLAKNTKVSTGPRHPSSIVANIGGTEYMYVFYQDLIYNDGTPNYAAELNTGNTKSGMKVIRAPTTNLAPGNWIAYGPNGFVDTALPASFTLSNMGKFLNKRGPRTKPLFANQMVPNNNGALYETERFSVAKVRGTNTYIGVEWYTEYRGQGGANCKDINGIDVPNLYKLALRVSSDLVGNPPKNPSVVKVENSMKEFLHEKEQIHRQPDHGYIEAGRDGYCSA
jgi:hypothetical protein